SAGKGAPSSVSSDVERLVQAAMLVEEIAGTLDSGARERSTMGPQAAPNPRAPAEPSPALHDPLPAPLVERARPALSLLGVAPPEGNWDTFEGFTLPNPPPAPHS